MAAVAATFAATVAHADSIGYDGSLSDFVNEIFEGDEWDSGTYTIDEQDYVYDAVTKKLTLNGVDLGSDVTGTHASEWNCVVNTKGKTVCPYDVVMSDGVDVGAWVPGSYVSDFENAHTDGWMGQGFTITGKQYGQFDTYSNLAPLSNGYHWKNKAFDGFHFPHKVNVFKQDADGNVNMESDRVAIRKNVWDDDTVVGAYIPGKKNTVSNSIVAAGTAVVWSKFDTLDGVGIANVMNSSANSDGSMNLGVAPSPYGALK